MTETKRPRISVAESKKFKEKIRRKILRQKGRFTAYSVAREKGENCLTPEFKRKLALCFLECKALAKKGKLTETFENRRWLFEVVKKNGRN